MKHIELKDKAKLRNTFIKRNLIPSTHNATIDLERMMLLHSVINGRRFNLGKIIWYKIWNCAKKGKGSLFFLNLITTLCRKTGVVEDRYDEVVPGSHAITNRRILKLMGLQGTPVREGTPKPVPNRKEMDLPRQI